MGVKIHFNLMTNVQLQKHIRLLSLNSASVFITEHARKRMHQRKVTDYQIIDCLRNGVMQRPATQDIKTRDIKCRMEHFGTSRNISVVVALSDQEPDLIIITVMTLSM
jgi:hypothetical protein